MIFYHYIYFAFSCFLIDGVSDLITNFENTMMIVSNQIIKLINASFAYYIK